MKAEASWRPAPPLPACQWAEDEDKGKARHTDSRAQARQAWQVGPSREERAADAETTRLSQAGGT